MRTCDVDVALSLFHAEWSRSNFISGNVPELVRDVEAIERDLEGDGDEKTAESREAVEDEAERKRGFKTRLKTDQCLSENESLFSRDRHYRFTLADSGEASMFNAQGGKDLLIWSTEHFSDALHHVKPPFKLCMQGDGNVVLYAKHGSDASIAIWATHTNGQGVAPYRFAVESDGRLSVRDAYDQVLPLPSLSFD